MDDNITQLKAVLIELHDKISNLNMGSEPFINKGAYTHPSFSVDDILSMITGMSAELDKLTKYVPDSEDLLSIQKTISMINNSDQTIAHVSHGNASVSSPALFSLMSMLMLVKFNISTFFSFKKLNDRSLVPKNIITRLELYKSNLDRISSDNSDIENKIKLINEAYDAAESLPTTLNMLKDANSELMEIKEQSIEIIDEVKSKHDDIIQFHKDCAKSDYQIESLLEKSKQEASDYMSALKSQAQDYIDKCEEAFRTTTSKGLAGAFEDKAKKLNVSIRYWVAGLVGALVFASIVGYFRLEVLSNYFSDPNASAFKMTVQIVMSLMSVGAPLWFAWLATKQIGQRFRLAEDYEFKASVSKAYEGYRREAIQLDDNFSQRLFGNALTRLEEAPLRFIDEPSHSSPIMEMLASENFKRFISENSDVADAMLSKVGLKRSVKIKKEDDAKPKDLSLTTSSDSE
nr:hypothetical protein [Serratia bockelmannii]